MLPVVEARPCQQAPPISLLVVDPTQVFFVGAVLDFYPQILDFFVAQRQLFTISPFFNILDDTHAPPSQLIPCENIRAYHCMVDIPPLKIAIFRILFK